MSIITPNYIQAQISMSKQHGQHNNQNKFNYTSSKKNVEKMVDNHKAVTAPKEVEKLVNTHDNKTPVVSLPKQVDPVKVVPVIQKTETNLKADVKTPKIEMESKTSNTNAVDYNDKKKKKFLYIILLGLGLLILLTLLAGIIGKRGADNDSMTNKTSNDSTYVVPPTQACNIATPTLLTSYFDGTTFTQVDSKSPNKDNTTDYYISSCKYEAKSDVNNNPIENYITIETRTYDSQDLYNSVAKTYSEVSKNIANYKMLPDLSDYAFSTYENGNDKTDTMLVYGYGKTFVSIKGYNSSESKQSLADRYYKIAKILTNRKQR